MEVGEDGKLTPVADGEYTITFTTAEGEDSTQVIDIDGGKISAIETAEESADEKAGASEEEGEEGETTEMSDEKKGAVSKDEAKSLPNTTDEDPRNSVGSDTDDGKDPLITLSFRIDELEKMVKDLHTKMQSAAPEAGAPEVSSLMPSGTNMSAVDEDEEELPKLDGAPVDPIAVQQNHKNFGKKTTGDYQSTVLSKMYRN